jgi:hypothetical protein
MEMAQGWIREQLVGTKETNSNSNTPNQKPNTGLAITSLRRLFWTSVVVADVFVLADALLNSGKILIELFFFFTGGYRG